MFTKECSQVTQQSSTSVSEKKTLAYFDGVPPPPLSHSRVEQLAILSSLAINSLVTVTRPNFKSAGVISVLELSLITKS